MMFPQIKKLQKISSNSKAIVVPNEWLSLKKIKDGQKIKVDVDKDYNLILKPLREVNRDGLA